MKILINSQRENDDDITVFWTLTDDNEKEYQFHGDCPKDIDIQSYLESKMPEYLKLIRNREYPDKPKLEPENGETELELTEEWIKDGCMLRDEDGKYTDKLEPIPWKSTHPEESEIDLLKARIEALEARYN